MQRNNESEIMDDFSITGNNIKEALKELIIINKFLGGISTTKSGLNKIVNKYKFKNNIKILDPGGGTSDILNSLTNKYNLDVTNLDINLGVSKTAKEFNNNLKVVTGNVHHLPFSKDYFDVIHASLFLHHFSDEDIQLLLKDFSNHANYAIIINDLRRSFLALSGIKILTKLFSKSKMVKNDAPLSVKKGFNKNELIKILLNAGFKNFQIKRKWAFRWLVVIYLK